MRVLKITETSFLQPVLVKAADIIRDSLSGGAVELVIQRFSRSRDQNAKFHALIGDISATVEVDGRYYSAEVWKALLVDDFEKERREMGEPLSHPGETVMSLDGRRAVTVRASTVKFRVSEASDFIEFLYAKGTEYGARFSDKSLEYYEEIIGDFE